MVDYYETNILKLQLIIILTLSVPLAYLLVRKMLVTSKLYHIFSRYLINGTGKGY
jgi:hypothetical protein